MGGGFVIGAIEWEQRGYVSKCCTKSAEHGSTIAQSNIASDLSRRQRR